MKPARLLDLCASLRLTLPLLFLLAGIAIYGTIWPSRDTELAVFRYELFYQSPWYRLLLILLAINLIACSIRLLQRRLREKQGWHQRLQDSGAGEKVDHPDPAAALKKAGFRLYPGATGILAIRHPWARWSVLVVHLSVLIIMAGALLGGSGFVGTLNIYIGDSSATYFDWDRQHDQPLGFSFRLDHFEPIFYPIELRFAAIDPTDGRQIQDYTVTEGETVTLPGRELQARVRRFDPLHQRLDFDILQAGQLQRTYTSTVGVKDATNTVAGLVLYPLAFRDPILKQYYSEVSILEGGKVVEQGIIQVNHPLIWRGVSIYQTAFNMDKDKRLYAGFQFSRDPGEPLVWGGAILLLLGLTANLLWRCRVVGLKQTERGWQLFPIRGFQGDAGRERLKQLTAKTGEPPPEVVLNNSQTGN